MIRIGRLTDYGIVLLSHMAAQPDSVHTAAEVAAEAHLPAPTVSKLLRLLTKEGLLESQRGVNGGYGLARTPDRITVSNVIAALEGPIAITTCTSAAPSDCAHEPICPVRGHLQPDQPRDPPGARQRHPGRPRPPPAPDCPCAASPSGRRPVGDGFDVHRQSEDRRLHQSRIRAGFVTDIEADSIPPGLNEDVVRLISAKKNEPAFMLEWRLKAFRHWLTMTEPHWQNVQLPADRLPGHHLLLGAEARPATGRRASTRSIPKLLETYEKLGIPLRERELLAGVAVDAVFDSVSVATTFKSKLAELGIIFCSFSEAVREHPELVQQVPRLGRAVHRQLLRRAQLGGLQRRLVLLHPEGRALPDGAVDLLPHQRRQDRPVRAHADHRRRGRYVSYLEGCTAPMRDENQLHAAVVELVALDDAPDQVLDRAELVPGRQGGQGRHLQLRHQARHCCEANAKISWTQVETGSAITWKYPSCILKGDNSVGEFYSVALTNNRQQADTGTKMIHIGKNTRSTILSKGISAGHGQNTYRGLVKVMKSAAGARNYTQCDSLLIGDRCGAHTFPYIEVRNASAQVEHEATTSKISDDQLFYCMQRGLSAEDAVSMIVNGFCKQVFKELPMEFAVEAQKLLGVSLEGSVG